MKRITIGCMFIFFIDPMFLRKGFCRYNQTVQLSEQESETILDILNGKERFFDNPFCGFDENRSLCVNEKTYCPACDTRCTAKGRSSGRYLQFYDTKEILLKKYLKHTAVVFRVFKKRGNQNDVSLSYP